MSFASVDDKYDVMELYRANFATARAHLVAGRSDNTADYARTMRINAKAEHLADEQTKRQVGPDAWRRFTSDRARAAQRRRPDGKVADHIEIPNPTRRGRRAKARSDARFPPTRHSLTTSG